jgi:hypothetical protein
MTSRAWGLAALLTMAAPDIAHAQIFLATRPDPVFAIGPLFVQAAVTPALGPVPVDVLFSVDVPPSRSAAEFAQDLFLIWPSALVGDAAAGPPDPALEHYLTARGLDVIDSGRVTLAARNLYRTDNAVADEPIRGGAPFATFVRDDTALGLSPPATWIRIPWDPKFANKVYLINLKLTTRGLLKLKPSTWVERTLWGPRHRFALSFNETRHRAVFPMYFQHRERILRLGDAPAQLMVNFAAADRLKIDEMSPASARRQLSETLESTDTISLFLDRSEGLTPQVLSVQFGYFTGLQSWAPVLIPTLFFLLGNVAAVLVRNVAERLSKRWTGRVLFARAGEPPQPRRHGVVLDPATVGRIVPGVTTYEEVRELCGYDAEEQSRLTAPDRRTLVYRGRRIVPRRRRAFGWLATVSHWDVERHEVHIDFEGDVVSDVQARVTRSRLPTPEAT